MPFKTEGNTTDWSPPTSDDIKAVQKQIWEAELHQSGVDPALTEELRHKIDEAVENLVPNMGWGVIAHSNAKVYDTIEAITSGPRGIVDIIIPVYNSIHIAKQCVKSVIDRTKWPYHIYLVDDASDDKTKRELERLRKARPHDITILTNIKNHGFAATVNRGIRAGKGEYVVLLNSDVLVTPLWLTKMLMAHKADPRNQIICPATNNTAIVQIPLSPGASYLQMNRVFEAFAVRRYPEIMPTGFCFMFPRSLIDKVGYFDEGYANFGEESDWWMKVVHYIDGDRYPRYRAVLADDTYVFHERGSSFSQLGAESHMHMRKLASGRFNEIWPQFHGWRKSYNVNKALGHLRDNVPSQLIGQTGKYHICWVVHSTAMCGGMRYIADLVNYVNENGGNARVAFIKRTRDADVTCLAELRTAPVIFEGYEDFLTNFSHKVFKKGVAVAATAELAGVVQTLAESNPNIKSVLHVQSYEPDMLPEGTQPSILKRITKAFTAIPNVISNSGWISKRIASELGVKPFATIAPGVDRDLFYPRGRDRGDERPTVMLPMYDKLPWRGFKRGIELIQEIEELARAREVDIRIMVYGVKRLPITSTAICLGHISQGRIAHLLGTEVDLFVDPSTLHSYGMPALEAIASGVAVAGWDNKGIKEYLDSDSVADSSTTPAELAKHVMSLLLDEPTIRASLAAKANECLPKHDRAKSVKKFVQALEKKLSLTIQSRRIVMVVPHLRKHGGPTTMLHIANKLAEHGHDVSITTVYTDINAEVAGATDLPISVDAQNIPACDLVITNSDNPMCDALSKLPQVKKKIMLKLSHNARFKQLEEQGLQTKWDAILTSTDWLREICANPGDWDYKPVDATRIGWWHYGHELMSKNPRSREYNDGSASKPITIATLIHKHSSKGTQDAVRALGSIFQRHNTKVTFVGIGEVSPKQFGINLPNFRYKLAPNRDEMAELLGKCDIWIGASHTEGLGRMALEAMSAGATCILSDTGAEYTEHNKNCLLYPVGNVDALYVSIESILGDPKLAARLREEGFRTARKYANPEPCMDVVEETIRKVFNG